MLLTTGKICVEAVMVVSRTALVKVWWCHIDSEFNWECSCFSRGKKNGE